MCVRSAPAGLRSGSSALTLAERYCFFRDASTSFISIIKTVASVQFDPRRKEDDVFSLEGQELQNLWYTTSWTLVVVFFQGFIMSDLSYQVLCSKTKLHSQTEELSTQFSLRSAEIALIFYYLVRLMIILLCFSPAAVPPGVH